MKGVFEDEAGNKRDVRLELLFRELRELYGGELDDRLDKNARL